MSYKKEFLEDLIVINKSIDDKQTLNEEIIKKIDSYLNKIISIGSFSIKTWTIDWRKEVYKFGQKFDKLNPEKVFTTINELIHNSNEESEVEVLEYFKSEVFLNFFTVDESIAYLKELTTRFNLNPEFKNSLAIQYLEIGKEDLYCLFSKQALKIDKQNKAWLDEIYKKEYGHAKDLISQKKHIEADKYINEIIDSNFYTEYFSQEYQNFFIFLLQRNDDQLLIENKLTEINQSSKKQIEELFDKSRVKIIEILGFFTAIIAFIFGAVTISTKLELSSALVLMSSFGFAMIVFILALSLIFQKNHQSVLKDKRLWGLIIILIINVSIIFLSAPLVKLIENILK